MRTVLCEDQRKEIAMTRAEPSRRRTYEDKRMGLEEALGLIKTGDHIFIGSAREEPQYHVGGLVEKASHLANNEIYSDRFGLNAFFVGINTVRRWLRGGLIVHLSFFRTFHDS